MAKKTVSWQARRPHEIVREVIFPVYRKHVISLSDATSVEHRHFTRWEETGDEWSVGETTHPDGAPTYELSHSRRDLVGNVDISSEDYVLGLGEHTCTRDEFRLVVKRAAQFMKFVSGLEKPLPEDRGVGV